VVNTTKATPRFLGCTSSKYESHSGRAVFGVCSIQTSAQGQPTADAGRAPQRATSGGCTNPIKHDFAQVQSIMSCPGEGDPHFHIFEITLVVRVVGWRNETQGSQADLRPNLFRPFIEHSSPRNHKAEIFMVLDVIGVVSCCMSRNDRGEKASSVNWLSKWAVSDIQKITYGESIISNSYLEMWMADGERRSCRLASKASRRNRRHEISIRTFFSTEGEMSSSSSEASHLPHSHYHHFVAFAIHSVPQCVSQAYLLRLLSP
jgi:hypothetical protein